MNLEILKNLDIEYWKNENPYLNDKSLSKGQKSAITTIQNGGKKGTGNRYLVNYQVENGLEIEIAINKNIEIYRQNRAEKEAIDTFDLVYLWGGVPRSGPYSRQGIRAKADAWLPCYKRFIELTFTGEIEAAIDEVNSIRGVGMAYGSKHLKFWGNYPVLDTRLSWLIFGEKLKPTAGGNDYVIYFQIIQELAGFFGLSPCETEEALFAFSERYFLHDKLTMKEGLVRGNGHDQRIANELCNAL